jgi:hypothetical protein
VGLVLRPVPVEVEVLTKVVPYQLRLRDQEEDPDGRRAAGRSLVIALNGAQESGRRNSGRRLVACTSPPFAQPTKHFDDDKFRGLKCTARILGQWIIDRYQVTSSVEHSRVLVPKTISDLHAAHPQP